MHCGTFSNPFRGNLWLQRSLIVVDGARSSSVDVKTGVPQGSVLGPCLFLCYINDLPSKISSPSRLFADDTAVYRFITCAEDPVKLQEDLQRLEQWEREWDMAFHPDKCSVLPFTRSHSPPLSNYTLHDQILERVTSTKYLGVILETKLDFTQHIESICAKANKTLGFLRRNLKVCSSRTKELAYKAWFDQLWSIPALYGIQTPTSSSQPLRRSSEGQPGSSPTATATLQV